MIYRGSRYADTEVYLSKKGAYVLDIRKRKRFSLEGATYYTFTQGDTLDGLSTRFYGKSTYWWVIMDANPRYAIEFQIKAGDVLRIPSPNEVLYART